MPIDKNHILSVALCDNLIQVVTRARGVLDTLCSDISQKKGNGSDIQPQINIDAIMSALGRADDEISKILDNITFDISNKSP